MTPRGNFHFYRGETFGEALQWWLWQRPEDITDLARIAGVNRNTLARWCRPGNTATSVAAVMRLAAYTGDEFLLIWLIKNAREGMAPPVKNRARRACEQVG